ncbi:MAG TPA: TonB-dependent receptor plug domain-containing protein [Candidatus Udaeobacter sp.]|jgi:Fe(3+) dicitrate transport protein|nr:TonB-dependent receptor plug domain-containing protein [Candidatus Udaeobacter sp.]
MSKDRKSARRLSAHSESFPNQPWLIVIATLVVFLSIRQPIAAQTADVSGVVVTAEAVATPTPHDNFREMRQHIMPEVAGTEITVTKKATVIKLDQQPPVENNNEQELFVKAPGFLITEQHTPGQFNFNYRGLGNPQESEFTLVLRDGLPLMSDWIGFPTLYYLPFPQSIREIQFIRGGSSLLYGPEPAPVVNFISKRPEPGSPWNFYTEQIGGGYGYYSTYNVIQEAMGPLEFRLDGGYVRADGQRDNSQYDIWQTDLYLGWRPDEHQLLSLEFYSSRFDGGDPGRIPYKQWVNDPNFSFTPYNNNWVDRYTTILSYQRDFGQGWLLLAKGWFTHQEIDARTAANLNPGAPHPFPTSTTFGYETFNNGGADVRFRKLWGDDSIFKGSALTFGGVVYHGDAPFIRYTLNEENSGPDFLYASRGSTSDIIPLDQSRTADYQAFFIEDLVRIGKFHMVGSFRLDHETVEVDSTHAPWLATVPPTGPASISADHWIPLWGFGMGNDFGNRNETYFSASSGWRPTRFFDIAGTTRTIAFGESIPDPFESLDFELGVHGTPYKGFWYDVGLFWMLFDNRTETQNISNTDFIILNTGSTRHRGLEGELYYDFLAPFQHPPALEVQPGPYKAVIDSKAAPVPGVLPTDYRPYKLIAFSNVQLLDAEFTESALLQPGEDRTLVGNTPAFAPDLVLKGGISFQREHCFNIALTAVYVSQQFWQDTNIGSPSIPKAHIPPYSVFNLSGELYLNKYLRLIAGISNLTDAKYYNRVFANGIEPAPRLSGYGGISLSF